jgi:hypothetical protein
MKMFPVVEVSGSAFERGRIHGEQARGRVERSLATYAKLFAFYGMDWAEAQSHTVASVIMQLARGVMHVAPDEPSRADYQPIALATGAMPA